jgi:hypothetical protein
MNMAERKIEMISNFIRLKPAHMKYLIPVLSAAMFTSVAYGQFEGVLHYDCTLKNQIVMTVYLSPSKARVEAKVIPYYDGKPVLAEAKDQRVIIFDLGSKKETTLNAGTNTAVVSSYTESRTDAAMKLSADDIIVENLGPEKIGNFSCDHFTVTIKGSKKDLWITKDLGTASLYVGSEFLYYAGGGPVAEKLAAAGAGGVVVKSQYGQLITLLTGYEKKSVPSSMFEPPAGYTVVNREKSFD